MEIECTQCQETFNSAVRQAADAFHIPLVSVYDAFDGVNHDEDPGKREPPEWTVSTHLNRANKQLLVFQTRLVTNR
jgi:hypothetical protein